MTGNKFPSEKNRLCVVNHINKDKPPVRRVPVIYLMIFHAFSSVSAEQTLCWNVSYTVSIQMTVDFGGLIWYVFVDRSL